MLDFLKTVHDFSIDESTKLTFDKTHPWHRNMVALYGSIIEFSSALVNSFDNNNIISIDPIFRSLLEAYVEFTNLSNDKCYGYHMEAAYSEQWVRLLKASKTTTNPYLKLIGEDSKTPKALADHEKDLEALKKKGYPPLNIFRKFEIAGMENEYRSVYNFLSNDSHSNIRALISRHFEIDTETGDFNVVFYKQWELEEYKHYITDAAFYLLKAGERLHELLDSKISAQFAEKLKELKEKHNNEESSS